MFSTHESPTTGLHYLMRGGTAPSFSFSRPFSRQGARAGQAGANAGQPTPPVGGLVGIAAHATSSRKTPAFGSSTTGGPTGHGSSAGTTKLGAASGVSKSRKSGSDRAPVKAVASANPGRAAIARPPPAHIVLDPPPLSPQGRKTRAIHEALRCIHLSPSHRSHAPAAEATASRDAPPSPTSPLASYLAKSSTTSRLSGHRLQSAKGPGPNKVSKMAGVERKKRNKSASAASRRRREEAGLQKDEMRSFLRTEDPVLLPDEGSEGEPEEEDYFRRFASELQLLAITQTNGPQPPCAPLPGQGVGPVANQLFFADQPQVQQRPPSRQKDAFPVHLADLDDLMPPKKRKDAFQVEVNEATQQHIKTTCKTASENPRPPSRHKPPATALFLEVPPSDVEDTPSFSAELAPPTWPVGRKQLVVDNRTDDPERDGFTLLDDGAPCPFKIEVTTELESDEEGEGPSLSGHSLLQKPATAHAPLGPTSGNGASSNGCAATAAAKTRPFAALFEPSSVFARLKVDTSPGKPTGKRPASLKCAVPSPLDLPLPSSLTPGHTPSPSCRTPPAATPLLQGPHSASPPSGPSLSSNASTCTSTTCATDRPPTSPPHATKLLSPPPPLSAFLGVSSNSKANGHRGSSNQEGQHDSRSPEWALSSAQWDPEPTPSVFSMTKGGNGRRGGKEGGRIGTALHQWGSGGGFMRRGSVMTSTAPPAFSADTSGGLWGQWSLESNLGEEFLSLFAPQQEEGTGGKPMMLAV